jgi:hypothetical protein
MNLFWQILGSMAKPKSRLYLKDAKHSSFLDTATTKQKQGWMT